jgi:hypothetical protein
MLTIDHHVQKALDKFNREMKRLNQGETVSSLAGQPSEAGPNVDRPEIVKRIAHKMPSKDTALNSFLTRRGVLFAKATQSSFLSTEEKLSWLSIGIWIPYHPL